MDYDVIIAGANYAGLGVAANLRGRRILLIEPHPIGTVQTSACGTLLAVLEATGTSDSLIQIQERILLHLGDTTVEFPLDYPFCTFDYATFCDRLLGQCEADILRASVLGHRGHMVFTTKGTFDAEMLVDATGWHAALATGDRARTTRPRGRSFGLETVLPVSDQGLHFYYDPKRLGRFNIGWLFPIHGEARVGVASYQGRTKLNKVLEDFTLSSSGNFPDGRHGGYFPFRRQPATTDHVFRVGDSAGQCFPFTGEGIRPALYFAAVAAGLIDRVLSGEMREPEALRNYRRLAHRHSWMYRLLSAAQWVLPRLPSGAIAAIARQVRRPVCLTPLLQAYWNSADPFDLSVGMDLATPSLGYALDDTAPELLSAEVRWQR